MPQAQLALADGARDVQQKLFHLLLAARLSDEAGDTAAASSARERADSVLVRQADQQRIEAEVADWKPEALVELPAENPDAS